MAAGDPLGGRVDGVARVAGLGVEGDAAAVSLWSPTPGSNDGSLSGKIRRVPEVFKVGILTGLCGPSGYTSPRGTRAPSCVPLHPSAQPNDPPPKENSHA